MRNRWIRLLMIVLVITILPVQPLQAASNTEGFDVSSKNGVIDWETVAEADMDFVMLRTGEGQAPDVDTQFEANYEEAKAIGLKVGGYHVCCVRTPEGAVREAEYCLEILGGRELDYPLAYDIEKAGCFADGIENTTAIAKAFCEVIAEAGYTPMIYSSSSYLSEFFDWSQLSEYKVWVANYGESKPVLPVAVDIWQYTAIGDLQGANTDQGYCDLNYSYMEARSIRFKTESLVMKKGSTSTASVKIGPKGCTDSLRFKSSDPKVVVVNKSTGKLRAKAKGKATITVTTGSGKTAKMKVTVKK